MLNYALKILVINKFRYKIFNKINLFKSNEAENWSFIKRQTSGTSSDNEWQRVVQRMTTSDNEWQQVVQRMTTSDNEWQRVTISGNFPFFQIREEPTTKHPKENSWNIKEDLWRRPIKLRAEASF